MANELLRLTVSYRDRKVGYLRLFEGNISFAYDEKWILDGFSISPRSLPLENRVFTASNLKFNSLFGVFADSLPDGWGTLTSIKYLSMEGISYLKLNPLEKLSLVGEGGLGALTYFPSEGPSLDEWKGTMDDVFRSSIETVEGGKTDLLDEVFAHESGTGGARPKAHLVIDGEEWIVKFRERNDPLWMGRMEYEYNKAAKACGIEVPETRLMRSENSDGYFASKRFDRKNGKRLHVISLSGLLEIPHEMPLLDYLTFLQATRFITQSQKEVENAFRLACFNIFSKNFDDHSKNFSFIYDESKKGYVLSPAYDLTRTIYQKEHEMTCNGNGLPNESDLFAISEKTGIPFKKAEQIISFVKNTVLKMLGEWIDK